VNNDKVRMAVTNACRVEWPGGRASDFVTLEDCDSRRVAIFIGPAIANRIASALERPDNPDPEALNSMLVQMTTSDASVLESYIHDIRDERYWAKVYFCSGGQTVECDSLPSNAILIALLARRPIYMSEAVISFGHKHCCELNETFSKQSARYAWAVGSGAWPPSPRPQ